jgi:hypothetical protein
MTTRITSTSNPVRIPAPPASAGLTGSDSAPLSKTIAHLLDTFIKIPGTNLRIGLDPIIGLIPGAGDAIANLMGSIILAEALQRGLPAPLVLRMGGNMLINAAVGAIPVVGDLFSAWFHSNSKNHALLTAFLAGNPNPPAHPQSKWVLLGFIAFTAVLLGFTFLAFYLLARLWKYWTAG